MHVPARSALAAAYVQAFEPPIYRVRVEPGEFYLAPTQMIIHDGQTGPNYPDTNLSFRVDPDIHSSVLATR